MDRHFDPSLAETAGSEDDTADAAERDRAADAGPLPRPPLATGKLAAPAEPSAGPQTASLSSGLTEGMSRWAAGFLVVLALHVGAAAYLLHAAREALDGPPGDAITVELSPDPSSEQAKPDDVAGPKAAESTTPTSDSAQADDPDLPAPDSAPPTEAQRKPDTPEAIAPTMPEGELQAKEKQEQPPDPVERQTAPSQAHSGSAALLSGAKRPSPAAQATWKGEIGTHLARKRRYPREARAKGWQGVARVRVTIDGDGHVLGRELVKSTGQPLLDGEALALMERADPFPKPPPGQPAPVVMTVPVNFTIR